ncbi:hypothetical protein ACFQDN_20390 [Pseudomonas asuensis]|uniref:Uncharacterized protein n=1 Tax=Pseudomonas asuensis TaxID=1825787 RepID=A0ABQ2H2H3_9PSED|nr:hypothetical protein [Pseudomonas asuensis]GGM29276.1 hypothetical protein GCM10009425_44800 [Pseudomonas asuensis]
MSCVLMLALYATIKTSAVIKSIQSYLSALTIAAITTVGGDATVGAIQSLGGL